MFVILQITPLSTLDRVNLQYVLRKLEKETNDILHDITNIDSVSRTTINSILIKKTWKIVRILLSFDFLFYFSANDF